MRNLTRVLLIGIMTYSSALSVEAQQPFAAQSERLIHIAPCRLLDTRINAPTGTGEEAGRRIDVASTRCGRFVPTIASAYAMRVTPYDRTNDGKIPPQAAAAQPELSRHPAGPPITFPIPPGSHITVDLEGYYVPPNTPLDPIEQGVPSKVTTMGTSHGSSGAGSAVSTGTPLRPRTEVLHDGTLGEFYLDGSRYPTSGVFGAASASLPWVMFMSGKSDGSDGFGIFNSNFSELMRVSSNGPTRFTQGWSYLSGRTDYRETPNIPNNVLHEVRIVNPRDAAGDATNRVTFFDAMTDDENGSPATTKYRAVTWGIQNHPDINFDSQIGNSFPGSPEYYYRAFSQREGRETFWIKADTNGDAFTNTRADMYVSGRVGIGTTAPLQPLHVSGGPIQINSGTSTADGVANRVPSIIFVRGDQTSSFANRITNSWSGTASSSTMNFEVGNGTGSGLATALVLRGDGKVGIGTTTPTNTLSVAGTIQTSGGVLYPDGNLQSAAFTGGTGAVSATNSTPTGPATLTAIAGDGTSSSHLAYVRLATNEATAPKDWRVGLTDGNGAFKIRDNAAGVDRMTISGAAITLDGSLTITHDLTVTGTVYANYQDVAEWVPSEGDMPAGTVVILNPLKTNAVTPSTKAYDTAVAGVVSGQPGVLLGVGGVNKAKIATTGRVKVRVDARTHAVHIGDLLVTSDIPGTAMLSEPLDLGGVKLHRPGTLIGKALEPLASGEGEILVLLSLQ